MSRANIPFALPLGLFLISALFGVVTAYAPVAALRDFVLIVCGAALYVMLIWKREDARFLVTAVALYVLGAAVLVLAFVAAQDATNHAVKLVALNSLDTFFGQLFPPLARFIGQPNSLAGIVAVALPLDIALAMHVAQRRARNAVAALFLLALILILGLVLADSRGAWLALALVGGVFGAGYAARRMQPQQTRLVFPSLLVLGLVVMLGAMQNQDLLSALVTRADFLAAAQGDEVPRLILYAQVWRLIQDYFFTGSGLGTFPMVYSTYALQIHVYFLPHAHNIFLQIWMEQGLLGVIAFVWFGIGFYAWMWARRAEWNWLAIGGLAAASVMLLHGLVDASFWYTAVTRPLLLMPFAFALTGVCASYSWKRDLKIGAAIGAAVLIAIAVFGQAALTRWYANVASVMQTRVELGQYQFPNALVEYIRHDGDLTGTQAAFHQVLALDSGNVTANERLAMIELARGEYADALAHAQAASARDAANPVTWQLLGDAYLALGNQDAAYAYWSRLDNAANLLNVEAAIRYDRQGDSVRAAWARALARRIK
jgi:O-antigen ligase